MIDNITKVKLIYQTELALCERDTNQFLERLAREHQSHTIVSVIPTFANGIYITTVVYKLGVHHHPQGMDDESIEAKRNRWMNSYTTPQL